MNNNYDNEEKKMSRTARRNYGRTHHTWVLAGAGFLSVGGNALHAATTSLPAWARVLIVMLYPLALLVATHSAVVVMREFTGWVRWATGSLALTTGLFSFVLSFVALREVSVMAGLPDNALAVIGALVLDLTIVQATIVVVMASRRIAADEAIDGPVVTGTEPRRPGALSRIGGNLVARVERATAVAPVDEAGRHRVEASAQSADERSAQSQLSTAQESLSIPLSTAQSVVDEQTEHRSVEPLLTPAQSVRSAEQPVAQSTAQSAQLSTDELFNSGAQSAAQSADLGLSGDGAQVLNGFEHADEEWLSTVLNEIGDRVERAEPAQLNGIEHHDEVLNEVLTAQTEQSDEVLNEALNPVLNPVRSEPIEQVAQTEETAAERTDDADAATDVRSLAEAVHRELNPKIDVETMASLIAAHREGASQRQLGELAGVSPNTAAKYVQAAQELAAD